jgi:hypothetical protein
MHSWIYIEFGIRNRVNRCQSSREAQCTSKTDQCPPHVGLETGREGYRQITKLAPAGRARYNHNVAWLWKSWEKSHRRAGATFLLDNSDKNLNCLAKYKSVPTSALKMYHGPMKKWSQGYHVNWASGFDDNMRSLRGAMLMLIWKFSRWEPLFMKSLNTKYRYCR